MERDVSRNLLHKSKLPAFLEWLSAQGIEHRETSADYQVAQVRMTPKNKPAYWAAVFDRLDAKEHYTTDKRLDGLVHQFCREIKEQA